MSTTRKIFYYCIVVCSVVLIIVSLLSLVHDLSLWYSKILDFPRLQYMITGILLFPVFLFLNKKWNLFSIIVGLGLIAVITIQSIKIFPYFFGDKAVPDADEQIAKSSEIEIVIANVLITNTSYDEFLKIIQEKNPDIVLAMEVDENWIQNLQVLKEDYAYHIEYPLDNAYGMAMYSKFPLENQIKFLNQEDVPSFHTKFSLPGGEEFMFHGVHPVAPVPSSKYPDNKGEEEIALIKIGDLVAKDSLPSIVAGDYNDVSWSLTSRLFEESGGLKNVRIGRGVFNTFDSNSMIMRWPLDHYFVTEEFYLSEIERLPEFGSDHFPLYVKLVLQGK
ncbi:endonuclease/exonuclease/phosphatase family protein [Salegentibacter sp. F188]|uniref:Endonuclease/exonuclease/phosphatase family protein n=1 Tax=Autumnicola patrickiae TaxID=3075591 RepID=A0ABU3E2T3_9FLAO|nr:endonuclease/exonuclease/phosphatase family protein [Salegentibacter sp. F188]MDT0689999.1 endonuclease/exonuclease/phosphatase family protein [Salegentibacter sp. F188]